MPRKSLVLSSTEVHELISPMVFIWRREGVVISILGSSVGLGRFSKGLDDIIKGFEFESGDTLELIWPEEDENIGSLAKELEIALEPLKKRKTQNTGTQWETKAERMERVEEKRREAKLRDEALDKMTEEALKQRWRMK